MNNKTPNFDEEFLTDLRNRLATEVNETQLQSICSKIDTDYNHLDGQSKQEKIAALIAALRESGRIHELIKVLQSEMNVLEIDKVARELARKEKRKVRKQRRLERRKRFLRSFFDDKPIAFEEELCNCWEFFATRVHYFFRPKHVKQKITYVSEAFNSINFLDNLKCKTEKGSRPSEQTSEKPKGVLKPDEKFVRFHSVRFWYRSIRSETYPFLWLIALLGAVGSFVLLAYLAGFLTVFTSGTGWPAVISQRDVTLSYTTTVSDTYYLQVKDLESPGTDYFVSVTNGDWLIPDFSEQSIWSISYGDRVLSELHMAEQHLYQIEGEKGDQIVVDIYDWYANSDLSFVLLDAQMNPIDDRLSSSDPRMSSTQLEYSFDSSEILYLRVQMPKEISRLPLSFPSLSLSSPYGFWVYKFMDDTNQEIEGTAVPIIIGSTVEGHLDETDRSDSYYFAAQSGTPLGIRARNLSDSPDSSLTLYRLIGDESIVIAHSNRSTDIDLPPDFLSTAYGRSLVISMLLEQVGLSVDPNEIEQPYIVLFYSVLALGFIGFVVYVFFIRFLATRKYEETVVILPIIGVLRELGHESALNCESKKATIRTKIKFAADKIQKIPKISRFPPLHAPPDELKHHLARVASQIRQMNEVVSIPAEGDLHSLRCKFFNWLAVLLKAEYGHFQFDEDFEMKSIAWHRKVEYFVRRHWKKMVIPVVFFLLSLLLTSILPIPDPLSIIRYIFEGHTESIIDGIWLATRYVILITSAYKIYHLWGVKGPSEQKQYKWEHVVRLILFFFIPLFGLDALLNTGIIEILFKLIGNLKGIF